MDKIQTSNLAKLESSMIVSMEHTYEGLKTRSCQEACLRDGCNLFGVTFLSRGFILEMVEHVPVKKFILEMVEPVS